VECVRFLECPVCRAELRRDGGALVCVRGHAFDVAREGYVNLLPGRRRLPATVGDTGEMLRARSRFLGAGHFDPLCELLEAAVAGELEAEGGGRRRALVDVGSGTGHHLGRIAARFVGRACWFGVDVSKAAARLGARTHPDATFVVADVARRLPIAAGGVAVVLNVFSPRNGDEFARVLEPRGLLVTVIPGPDHLTELAGPLGLLGIERDKEERLAAELERRFDLADRRELTYTMELDPDAAIDAAAMGPSAHHVDLRRLRERLPSGPTRVTASFVALRFRPVR
jgi:23S rRNA (guanine745-N1)-methyltransferase